MDDNIVIFPRTAPNQEDGSLEKLRSNQSYFESWSQALTRTAPAGDVPTGSSQWIEAWIEESLKNVTKEELIRIKQTPGIVNMLVAVCPSLTRLLRSGLWFEDAFRAAVRVQAGTYTDGTPYSIALFMFGSGVTLGLNMHSCDPTNQREKEHRLEHRDFHSHRSRHLSVSENYLRNRDDKEYFSAMHPMQVGDLLKCFIKEANVANGGYTAQKSSAEIITIEFKQIIDDTVMLDWALLINTQLYHVLHSN